MLMFLKKSLLDAVKEGHKTQTLRKQKLHLKPGHIISFGGHAHVSVLSCDRIALNALSENDAQREGFNSLPELLSCLKTLSMTDTPELTRIRFQLVKP